MLLHLENRPIVVKSALVGSKGEWKHRGPARFLVDLGHISVETKSHVHTHLLSCVLVELIDLTK